MESTLERQIERIRAMTADEKLRISHALWLEAWGVTLAGVRARHPDWSEPEVMVEVRELMSGAGA